MPSNVVAEAVGTIFERRLDASTDRLLLVNPDTDTMARLVETLAAHDDPPRVSVLADTHLLKAVMEDFLVASRAADLVEDDLLELRSVEEPPNQSLLVSEEEVTALVFVGDGVGALGTDAAEFVDAATEYYADRFDSAETFVLRTPALSRIRQTLEEEIGPATVADFDEVLAAAERTNGGMETLDEVTISLLVAARNGELLYDISKWGEDVGLASKATFSRTKTTLEDAGLIETEKVPIQVGRPRLRLLLGDERLAEATPEEMAARVRQRLES